MAQQLATAFETFDQVVDFLEHFTDLEDPRQRAKVPRAQGLDPARPPCPSFGRRSAPCADRVGRRPLTNPPPSQQPRRPSHHHALRRCTSLGAGRRSGEPSSSSWSGFRPILVLSARQPRDEPLVLSVSNPRIRDRSTVAATPAPRPVHRSIRPVHAPLNPARKKLRLHLAKADIRG